VEIRPVHGRELHTIITGLPERSPEQHRARHQVQEQGDGVYLIAWKGHTPVGHVTLRWPWWPERHVPEFSARYDCSFVGDLSVLVESRNQGVGRGLMETIERLTRDSQLKRIGLGVGLDEGYTAAHHLYESLGYRDMGHGAYLTSATVEGGGVWMEWIVFLVKELRP
jgi:GNAT superfamily N-acetyltransferase